MSLLEQELQQARPIDDPAVATILSVLKTGDMMRRELEAAVEQHGITWQQYNVLLALRDAGAKGMPVLDIVDRMIEDNSNVTRLLDRLAAKGLTERVRSQRDRRVVYARLTPTGERLIEQARGAVNAARRSLCRALSQSDMEHLIRLLEKARRGIYLLADS